MRLWLAVFLARAAGWASRVLGHGGSSLPGAVARAIAPSVLQELGRRLPSGAVLVTGTNGKTTTAALAEHLMRRGGRAVLRNQTGANLVLGLTAALIQATGWRLLPRADLALLETDEASVPRAAAELRPRGIVVTNFFRDQLDRYGELTHAVRLVARGLEALDPDGRAILNADDPNVARLGEPLRSEQVVFYGMVAGWGDPEDSPGDVRHCPLCGAELLYRRRFYAHLGEYRCTGCGWQRPPLTVAVEEMDLVHRRVKVRFGDVAAWVPAVLPGTYNLYNQLAAMAWAWSWGMAPDALGEALNDFRPAFGRMERTAVRGREVWFALVKNPTGFNQVLATLAAEPQAAVGLVAINDDYADGRDVSWLWDVDFERWLPRVAVRQWWVSGRRALDMAVRLKYAGVAAEALTIEEDLARALEGAVDSAAGRVYVLPTYTAMLALRRHLTKQGAVRHFRQG